MQVGVRRGNIDQENKKSRPSIRDGHERKQQMEQHIRLGKGSFSREEVGVIKVFLGVDRSVA